MKKLNRNGAAERRAQYYRLRLDGQSVDHAALAVGVTDPSTKKLYERWFLALHPGAAPPAGQPGRQFNPNHAGSAS